MTKTSSWLIYAVVGLVILFAVGFLLKTNQPQPIKQAEKVTVDNEFTRSPVPGKISLEVTSPQNGETVRSQSVIVRGKTLANAEVFVNEKDIQADAQGNFSVVYPLEEGENYLIVGASDEEGNETEQELTVFFEG